MKRNYNIDFLKGIAAVFVVFIHVKFIGIVGDYIANIGTFAVPIFFITSGYFAKSVSNYKLKKKISHVIVLILVAYVLNIIRIIIEYRKQTIDYFFDNVFTVKHLILWVVFNNTQISGVAWFLWALLYCYIIHLILNKRINRLRFVAWISILSFACGIVLSVILPTIGISFTGTNNVWFCGLPYYLTGIIIKIITDPTQTENKQTNIHTYIHFQY